ncbi:hypothetical protein LJC46_06135 [Desulfovibrio sp. OttesenSCG-928-G15]|nr:hypothetical protein [Desulfovibrio sp. OttesenSCG-928-G15]
MATPTRGERLARRYPILAGVPEAERPAIARAALRNPLLLLIVLGGGLLLLPLYFDFAFRFLGVEAEQNMMMQLTKLAGSVLLPIAIVVPLLSRFVVPAFIRREMIKRGLTPPSV